MFISIVLTNLFVETEVLDIFAITESEFSKFEVLEPLLKKNRLIRKSIAIRNAIFDLFNILNMLIINDFACIIIVSIKKRKKYD